MNAPHDFHGDAALAKMVSDWGLTAPAQWHDILLLGSRLNGMMSGKAAVELGIISRAVAEELFARKPPDIPVLEWYGRHHEAIQQSRQKILALTNGMPYVENIATVSDEMEKTDVRARCAELDAVLIVPEETSGTRWLLFSDYETLRLFSQMGRARIATDPIHLACSKGRIVLGIADRAAVVAALHTTGSVEVYQEGASRVWDASRKIGLMTEPQRILAQIIDISIGHGATDIEIKPLQDGGGTVRIRVNGDMEAPDELSSRFPREVTEEMSRFLQSESGANTGGARLREPADGSFIYHSLHGDTFLRLSFIPLDRTQSDADMVSISIRLMPRGKEDDITLEKLQIHEMVITEIRRALLLSQGTIVIAGPTNTGKSTTIAGAMRMDWDLYGNRKKRVSIEDPVERVLDWLSQISANPKDKHSFAQIFRAVLRHDPDTVWVGEVRDQATAETCIDAAITGHTVVTTLHAKDTPSAYRNLANKVSADKRFDLVDSLTLIIGQRLVKQLCPHCSTERRLNTQELADIAHYCESENYHLPLPDIVRERDPRGCPECRRGIKGVLPINELLPVTADLKDVMVEMLSRGSFSFAEVKKHRTLTLFESAMALVKSGRAEVESLLI